MRRRFGIYIPCILRGGKGWYLVNRSDREGFERALASYMLFPEYLNDHEEDARQTIAMKSTISDLRYLSNLKCSVNVLHAIQTKRPFVILAPPAHHGDSIVGKALQKLLIFSISYGADSGRVVSSSMERFVLISNALFQFSLYFGRNVPS